jgi:transcriptional regulator with XRE-family HTH domain
MDKYIDESGLRESQPALGRAIRVLREQGNLTSDALAGRAGVPLGRLQQIEAGEGGDWNAISHIARALGVSMEELSELEESFVREEEDADPSPKDAEEASKMKLTQVPSVTPVSRRSKRA